MAKLASMKYGALLSLLLVGLVACRGTGYEKDAREATNDAPENNPAVRETMAKFIAADAGLERYFENSYGYAIYPKVGKAGATT